jgi:hypothetical protein
MLPLFDEVVANLSDESWTGIYFGPIIAEPDDRSTI